MVLPKQIIQNVALISILLVGVAVGVLLINQQTFFRLRAKGSELINPRTTNITDSSFTVTWTTTEPTNGFVRWNTRPGELNRIAIDRKNISSRAHSITISDLSPNTAYYYVVATNGDLYGKNGAEPFSITTASVPYQKSSANTIYGKVLSADGKPIANALVFLETEMISPISTKTDGDGGWVLSLSGLRSKDLQAFVEFTPQSPITIEFNDGRNNIRKERFLVSEAKPTRDIIVR